VLYKSNMAKSLKEIVSDRLAELGRNKFEAERIGGLKKGFVNDILIDRKTSIQGANFAKLAKALDWTPEQLTESQFGETRRRNHPHQEPPEPIVENKRRGIPEYDLRGGASYGGGYALPGDHSAGQAQERVKDQWFFPSSWLKGEMRLSLQFTDIISIDGPSMLPDLSPGDRVLIDRSNQDPKQDAIFAIRDGDSVIVKHVQLMRNSDPPRIICRSSNPKYEPFELILDGDNVAIIGRVAGRISRL
jgi:hypothetical protein